VNERPKVVPLPPSGLAVTNRQLAERLRGLADEVEGGEWGDIDHVVAVIDGPTLEHVVYGHVCSRATTVGMLTYAIHNIMHPDR